MERGDLFLHEELILLALRDETGTVASGTMYPYAVGGAVLTELILAGRVQLRPEKKKLLVEVVERDPLGDPLIDEWLRAMTEREKLRTLQDWVGRIAHGRDLKHRIATGLSRRGILRTTEDKILGIFTRTVYPELDPGPERALLERLEDAIFGDGQVDDRTAVLVALAHHGSILSQVFDKKKLKERKGRLETVAAGSVTADATKAVIQATQAAFLVAVIVPSIVTTTVVTS